MKICPLGAKFFHAGGKTDITKLIIAYRNFANTPENVFIYVHVRNVFRVQKAPCKENRGAHSPGLKRPGRMKTKTEPI
jgi:hypothetical protein